MNPQKSVSFLLVLLAVVFGFAQTDHDHGHHAASSGPKANILELGDLVLEINPMLLPGGNFSLGFMAMHADDIATTESHDHSSEDHSHDHSSEEDAHAHSDEASSATDEHADHNADSHDSTLTESLNLSLTTPSGNVVSLEGDAMTALSADLGSIESGSYQISGMLGSHEVQSSVSVYIGKTDLDSDVYVILAPTPSLSGMGLSEAFVYAIAGDENIHTQYLINRKMAGMTHMTDEEEIELVHNHFDAFRTDDFKPAGNDAPVSFPMVGDWEFTVNLMSSVPETASFTVSVLDQ